MIYVVPTALKYRIQVSVKDCTGCGLCVEACPAKGKALVMRPYEEEKKSRGYELGVCYDVTSKGKPGKTEYCF